MKKLLTLCLFLVLFGEIVRAQPAGTVRGRVMAGGKGLGFTSIGLEGTTYAATSDAEGNFELKNIPFGQYRLRVSFVGYAPYEQLLTLSDRTPLIECSIVLTELPASLDEVVVTGTRTARKRTESPVAVDVLSSKIFDLTQSASLKEGLCFQPGLRVEVNCQTCNYSQLRMNGLGGSYTQILINSRPVFSALNGLYGLEQIPTNLIERVEVVRGGGSALYGSSAIAGTVNIITKEPTQNTYSLSVNQALTGGQSNDNQLNAAASVVNPQRRAGLTLIANRRQRNEYDANGDGFSELPRLLNHTFGVNSFWKPGDRSKLNLSLHAMNEERDGGDQLDRAPHERQQTEWRDSRILVGTLDYDLRFRDGKSNLSLYAGAQNTQRRHYTGVDGVNGYGRTRNHTLQAGAQYNYVTQWLGGRNTLTAGFEYQHDDVFDQIEAYRYLIDQTTRQLGVFAQSDWEISRRVTALLGLRANKHNFVANWVLNPRLSLLYKWSSRTKIRASYANGFRAPQAFDTDMHMAFANGGVSLIRLDPNLRPEYSHSYSASLDFDRPGENAIYGFTVSAFYTRLLQSFVLEQTGTDDQGNIQLTKLNGGGSVVAGLSVEGRLNWSQVLELDLGLTLQQSRYDAPIRWSDEIAGTRQYLRSPNRYGYYTLTYTPQPKLSFALSGVYTGPMLVPHFGGAPGVAGDRVFTSPDFLETNLKTSYAFSFKGTATRLQAFAGVQNLFNQFQRDFDIGKNRDSNYIYGPSRPRTFFVGMKVGIF